MSRGSAPAIRSPFGLRACASDLRRFPTPSVHPKGYVAEPMQSAPIRPPTPVLTPLLPSLPYVQKRIEFAFSVPAKLPSEYCSNGPLVTLKISVLTAAFEAGGVFSPAWTALRPRKSVREPQLSISFWTAGAGTDRSRCWRPGRAAARRRSRESLSIRARCRVLSRPRRRSGSRLGGHHRDSQRRRSILRSPDARASLSAFRTNRRRRLLR